jgi:hypothetical protein
MKTEEDEAFDELAKRQGMWGGGFQAKRAMAKARIDDDDDIQDYRKPWVGLTDAERNDCLVKADPCECLADPEAHQLMVEVEAMLKEKNG